MHVGCNLRFLPSLQLVRRLVDDGRIGRPLSARAHCGYYLPHWRPTTDYRDAWTLGYTPDLAVGVWLGNADNKPMQKVAGSIGAAPALSLGSAGKTELPSSRFRNNSMSLCLSVSGRFVTVE